MLRTLVVVTHIVNKAINLLKTKIMFIINLRNKKNLQIFTVNSNICLKIMGKGCNFKYKLNMVLEGFLYTI